jgi:hypothetical protein
MNFKAFISVNIHTVALSWSSRERDHPAPAARSMLHLVWDTRYIFQLPDFAKIFSSEFGRFHHMFFQDNVVFMETKGW